MKNSSRDSVMEEPLVIWVFALESDVLNLHKKRIWLLLLGLYVILCLTVTGFASLQKQETSFPLFVRFLWAFLFLLASFFAGFSLIAEFSKARQRQYVQKSLSFSLHIKWMWGYGVVGFLSFLLWGGLSWFRW